MAKLALLLVLVAYAAASRRDACPDVQRRSDECCQPTTAQLAYGMTARVKCQGGQVQIEVDRPVDTSLTLSASVIRTKPNGDIEEQVCSLRSAIKPSDENDGPLVPLPPAATQKPTKPPQAPIKPADIIYDDGIQQVQADDMPQKPQQAPIKPADFEYPEFDAPEMQMNRMGATRQRTNQIWELSCGLETSVAETCPGTPAGESISTLLSAAAFVRLEVRKALDTVVEEVTLYNIKVECRAFLNQPCNGQAEPSEKEARVAVCRPVGFKVDGVQLPGHPTTTTFQSTVSPADSVNPFGPNNSLFDWRICSLSYSGDGIIDPKCTPSSIFREIAGTGPNQTPAGQQVIADLVGTAPNPHQVDLAARVLFCKRDQSVGGSASDCSAATCQ